MATMTTMTLTMQTDDAVLKMVMMTTVTMTMSIDGQDVAPPKDATALDWQMSVARMGWSSTAPWGASASSSDQAPPDFFVDPEYD